MKHLWEEGARNQKLTIHHLEEKGKNKWSSMAAAAERIIVFMTTVLDLLFLKLCNIDSRWHHIGCGLLEIMLFF